MQVSHSSRIATIQTSQAIWAVTTSTKWTVNIPCRPTRLPSPLMMIECNRQLQDPVILPFDAISCWPNSHISLLCLRTSPFTFILLCHSFTSLFCMIIFSALLGATRSRFNHQFCPNLFICFPFCTELGAVVRDRASRSCAQPPRCNLNWIYSIIAVMFVVSPIVL